MIRTPVQAHPLRRARSELHRRLPYHKNTRSSARLPSGGGGGGSGGGGGGRGVGGGDGGVGVVGL